MIPQQGQTQLLQKKLEEFEISCHVIHHTKRTCNPAKHQLNYVDASGIRVALIFLTATVILKEKLVTSSRTGEI